MRKVDNGGKNRENKLGLNWAKPSSSRDFTSINMHERRPTGMPTTCAHSMLFENIFVVAGVLKGEE